MLRVWKVHYRFSIDSTQIDQRKKVYSKSARYKYKLNYWNQILGGLCLYVSAAVSTEALGPLFHFLRFNKKYVSWVSNEIHRSEVVHHISVLFQHYWKTDTLLNFYCKAAVVMEPENFQT